MPHSYDLFVIGAGSGGIRAARTAAARGARVAVAEDGTLGGTCVNRGCIPKKLYAMAALYADDFADAAGFGWCLPEPTLQWATLRDRVLGEVARLNGIYRGLLDSASATLVTGHARITGPNTVVVRTAEGERTFESQQILVATGAIAEVPQIPGGELALVSDQMFDLEQLPSRLVVVGGGYIACEFATIFARLGSHVAQVHRGERLLRGFDHELADLVATQARDRGVDLRLGRKVAALEQRPGGVTVQLDNGDTVPASHVLYAIGRRPHTRGIGLEELGVKLRHNGAVCVDEAFRSSVPSIHALGDASSPLQLTPVALAEAMTFVDHGWGEGTRSMSYDNVPTAVFSLPNVGSVGFSEEAARQKFERVEVYRSEFRPLRATLSGRQEKTFMKLVVDATTDRVLGAHMVGRDAGEMIQGVAIALKAGATKATLDATIGIHPTVAEEFVTMRDKVH